MKNKQKVLAVQIAIVVALVVAALIFSNLHVTVEERCDRWRELTNACAEGGGLGNLLKGDQNGLLDYMTCMKEAHEKVGLEKLGAEEMEEFNEYCIQGRMLEALKGLIPNEPIDEVAKPALDVGEPTQPFIR